MKSFCDKNIIQIIALRRPTAVDQLAQTIPMPKGAIPDFGLPRWKVMPLESKIPMVPGPEGVYNFTRRKIGKKLWISALDAEFNLSDPYCYEMKFNYDSLHDKHLIPYFSKPHNIRHLIKAGLITKNLDAKCSLRDYNMYRKYLRKLHCDSVKKELRRRASWNNEERALHYANEQAQKEIKKLKDREILMETRRAVIRKRNLEEKLKVKAQKEKQKKIQQRLERLALEKQEAQRSRYAKSRELVESLLQKRKAAVNIRRRKIIHTLLEWSKKERVRKKTRAIRLAHEQEEKRKAIEQKWEIRQEFQKKSIEQEQLLLECINNRRAEFILQYNDKVQRESERMKRLLEQVKIYIKCYLARRLPGDRERICCEKYMDDDVSVKHTVSKPKQTPKDGAQNDLQRHARKQVSTKKPHSQQILTEHKKDKVHKMKIEKPKEKLKYRKVIGKRKSDIKKGDKRKKKKVRKSKRRKSVKSEEEDSQSDLMEDTESASKMKQTPKSSSTESVIKDRCRCEIIKAAK